MGALGALVIFDAVTLFLVSLGVRLFELLWLVFRYFAFRIDSFHIHINLMITAIKINPLSFLFFLFLGKPLSGIEPESKIV